MTGTTIPTGYTPIPTCPSSAALDDDQLGADRQRGRHAPSSNGANLDQDAFLKLLVAQLKYQDPSKPVDSSQFMAQTAQFTQVQKMTEMTKATESVLALQQGLAASALSARPCSTPSPTAPPAPGPRSRPASAWPSKPNRPSGSATQDIPLSSITTVGDPRYDVPAPRPPQHHPLPPAAQQKEVSIMLRSLFSSISGMRANQTMMDVVGNNIANVNTDRLQVLLGHVRGHPQPDAAGRLGAPQNRLGGTNPAQVGLGVRLAGITTNFTQGAAADHRPLDRPDAPGRRLLRRQQGRRSRCTPATARSASTRPATWSTPTAAWSRAGPRSTATSTPRARSARSRCRSAPRCRRSHDDGRQLRRQPAVGRRGGSVRTAKLDVYDDAGQRALARRDVHQGRRHALGRLARRRRQRAGHRHAGLRWYADRHPGRPR